MLSLRHASLLASLVLPQLAACVPPPEPTGEAASPIIGGASDSGDPAVMLLASYPPDMAVLDTCTAVLVAPQVLLTAAHCVDEENHPEHTFGIFPGPDASDFENAQLLAPELLAVSEVHAHPDYDPKPPFHADIGVVLLDKPLLTPPLPFNREELKKDIEGEPARIVGYGQLTYGKYNAVKHAAETSVASLDEEDTVVVGDPKHRSCVGDSGGPALVIMNGVEKVIGVDSYTDTTGCVEPAHYQRTDAYLDFIDKYAPPPGTGGSGTTAGVGGGSGSGSGGGSSSDSGSGDEASGGCAVAPGRGQGGAGLLAALPIALAVGLRRRSRAARAIV